MPRADNFHALKWEISLCSILTHYYDAHLKPLLKLLILLHLFIKPKVEKQEEETSPRKGTM